MTNFHTDPRALIFEAAERSGLLDGVAEFLWFVNRHPGMAPCPQCQLLAELIAAFDSHCCLAGIVGERVFGGGYEGLDISPRPGVEAADFANYLAQFKPAAP